MKKYMDVENTEHNPSKRKLDTQNLISILDLLYLLHCIFYWGFSNNYD